MFIRQTTQTDALAQETRGDSEVCKDIKIRRSLTGLEEQPRVHEADSQEKIKKQNKTDKTPLRISWMDLSMWGCDILGMWSDSVK